MMRRIYQLTEVEWARVIELDAQLKLLQAELGNKYSFDPATVRAADEESRTISAVALRAHRETDMERVWERESSIRRVEESVDELAHLTPLQVSIDQHGGKRDRSRG